MFGDVSGCIQFNSMQKPSDVLWKIWVNQPLFHSGPVWWFELQLYFILLWCPWPFSLLVALPSKPLSPEEWTHWRFWSACNKPFFFLSKTGVLQNLHYQLPVFAKLIGPPSPASKETLIWRFWPLQELPKCIWHSVEHLVCTVIFGKLSGFALWTWTPDLSTLSTECLATPTSILCSASSTLEL